MADMEIGNDGGKQAGVYRAIRSDAVNKIQLVYRGLRADEVVGWPRVSEVADTRVAGRNGSGEAKTRRRDVCTLID